MAWYRVSINGLIGPADKVILAGEQANSTGPFPAESRKAHTVLRRGMMGSSPGSVSSEIEKPG